MTILNGRDRPVARIGAYELVAQDSDHGPNIDFTLVTDLLARLCDADKLEGAKKGSFEVFLLGHATQDMALVEVAGFRTA